MTEKRTWVGPSAPERLNILRNTRTIAIVGMSDKISRAQLCGNLPAVFIAVYSVFCEPDSCGERQARTGAAGVRLASGPTRSARSRRDFPPQ